MMENIELEVLQANTWVKSHEPVDSGVALHSHRIKTDTAAAVLPIIDN
jgi:hypothetical protein